MKQIQSSLRIVALSLTALPVLTLAACDGGSGGGWQPVAYENVPYTMERTAGRGVTFVRAAMLPPKEAKVEPMMEKPAPAPEPAPAPVPTEPITAGDKVFEKKQAK